MIIQIDEEINESDEDNDNSFVGESVKYLNDGKDKNNAGLSYYYYDYYDYYK